MEIKELQPVLSATKRGMGTLQLTPHHRYRDEETHHLACDLIMKTYPESFEKSPEEALKDEGWVASVVFMANEFVPKDSSQFGQWDHENKAMLRKLFDNPMKSPVLFCKIIEPILHNRKISGVDSRSKAIPAASDYAAKFLRLVNMLVDMGPRATTELFPYEDRLDYFRSLVLWVEWHVVSTCTDPQKKIFLANNFMLHGIPSMADKERLGDQWGKRFRENYCFMVQELTGVDVTYHDVEKCYSLWSAAPLVRQEPMP